MAGEIVPYCRAKPVPHQGGLRLNRRDIPRSTSWAPPICTPEERDERRRRLGRERQGIERASLMAIGKATTSNSTTSDRRRTETGFGGSKCLQRISNIDLNVLFDLLTLRLDPFALDQ